MKNKLEQKLIKDIVSFSKNEVAKFLKTHGELEFYAFAFDCNAEYASVGLCLNTETDFEADKQYWAEQEDKFDIGYNSEEFIYNLRYNTGEWKYQGISWGDFAEHSSVKTIFPQGIQIESMMEIFCRALLAFQGTSIYRKIPKTNDFRILCLDHDEYIEKAEQRLDLVKQKLQL